MEVRMKTTMAGPAGSVREGEIAHVSAEHGEALISGGYADLVSAASDGGPAEVRAAVGGKAKAKAKGKGGPETADTAADEHAAQTPAEDATNPAPERV